MHMQATAAAEPPSRRNIRVTFRPRLSRAVILFLSLLAIAVQGYHYGVDDAAIYIPAVERFAHPSLFPYGADFFLSHSRVSIFSKVVGAAVRWLHMPLSWAVLAFHVLGIYLLLLAGHWLATLCFTRARAQWAATLTLASVLTFRLQAQRCLSWIPISRRARSPRRLRSLLSRPSSRRVQPLRWFCSPSPHRCIPRWRLTALRWWCSLCRDSRPTRVPAEEALAGSIGFFVRLPTDFISGPRRSPIARRFTHAPSSLPGHGPGMSGPVSAAARNPLCHHAHPLIGGHACGGATLPRLAGARAASPSRRFFSSAPAATSMTSCACSPCAPSNSSTSSCSCCSAAWQRVSTARKVWRWLLLFLPISATMYGVDRSLYPASHHLELPGRAVVNPWLQAFNWVRYNTPEDAVFALPPRYL